MVQVKGEFVCTGNEKDEVDFMLGVHKAVQDNVDRVGDTPASKQAVYDAIMNTELGELYQQAKDCVLSFPGYTENDLPIVEVPEFGVIAMGLIGVGLFGGIMVAKIFKNKFDMRKSR